MAVPTLTARADPYFPLTYSHALVSGDNVIFYFTGKHSPGLLASCTGTFTFNNGDLSGTYNRYNGGLSWYESSGIYYFVATPYAFGLSSFGDDFSGADFSFSGSAGAYTAQETGFVPILQPLVGFFTESRIVLTLLSVVGFTIGLVFAWWGMRKINNLIMRAWKRGRQNV